MCEPVRLGWFGLEGSGSGRSNDGGLRVGVEDVSQLVLRFVSR